MQSNYTKLEKIFKLKSLLEKISKGFNDLTIRKSTANARKWKHEHGGVLKAMTGAEMRLADENKALKLQLNNINKGQAIGKGIGELANTATKFFQQKNAFSLFGKENDKAITDAEEEASKLTSEEQKAAAINAAKMNVKAPLAPTEEETGEGTITEDGRKLFGAEAEEYMSPENIAARKAKLASIISTEENKKINPILPESLTTDPQLNAVTPSSVTNVSPTLETTHPLLEAYKKAKLNVEAFKANYDKYINLGTYTEEEAEAKYEELKKILNDSRTAWNEYLRSLPGDNTVIDTFSKTTPSNRLGGILKPSMKNKLQYLNKLKN